MTDTPIESVLDLVNHTTTTVLTKAFGPVPDGEEWSVHVRLCNSGSADDVFHMRVRKSDGSNSCFRARNKSVPLNDSPFNIETDLKLKAGYELWDQSSAGYVDASYSGTKKVAPKKVTP
ncbi:hypothetical protein [Sphingomonas sp. PR090111-T3T-6A]|uniref:hypothetical protein n=1 Tax=Sphingomonas sp. PR090111-T3T-6A TaxID=685778 RepID=UPI000360A1E8|nr:hypothetical protein [Sphingomonas sp. PR090111-T3T-6A]